MLTDISPKLPMRDKAVTLAYCVNMLGFRRVIGAEHADYLMVEKDKVQLHFFLFAGLDPLANYGQVTCAQTISTHCTGPYWKTKSSSIPPATCRLNRGDSASLRCLTRTTIY